MAAGSRDPAKEHAMLSKVLSASLAPPTPDLAELAAELEAEGVGGQLSTEAVERVLMAKMSARPLLAERVTYAKDCLQRCDEVRRDAKFPAPVMEQVPKVQQMLGNYAGLAVSCAELFGHEPADPSQAAATLRGMWEKRELPLTFLTRLADSMEEEQLPEIFGALLAEICRRVQGRDLMDQKCEDLHWVTQICATKGPLARLLVTLPIFHPPAASPVVQPFMPMMPGSSSNKPQQPGEGFRLQTQSLLGFVLSPTCVDTALYKDKSARQIHFQNLARKTQPMVTSAQRMLRHSMGEVMTQAGGIVNPLLRSGDASREAVLLWFAALVTGTESRTKSSNTLDEGGGPSHFVDSMDNSPMPMHQNLDMRLQMQLMQANMQGFATPGMSLNALWCLMTLVKPIKLAQVTTLDPFYILLEGDVHARALGGFREEARFGDSDEVEGAKELAKADGLISESPKFTTQVFWIALRALHVLLIPVLKEEICFAVAAGHFQKKDLAKMEAALAEHWLHETILDDTAWHMDLAALLNLEMAFCLCAAFPDKAQQIAMGSLREGSILTDEVSPQWAVLPSCILEDLIEILEYSINIRPPGQGRSELFSHLNTELLLLLITFILGSSNHIKNPNLRGKATTILMSLCSQPNYLHVLENSPVLANDIVPGCIRVFTAVEKTKRSYYDIRMQLKYQLRIPIMELIEKVLPLEAHKKSLKRFAAENSDEFLKFLNQMMNDATMQLEEGLDTLVEIRRLVKEGGEAALSGPSQEQLAENDEATGDGADLYRRSRADPREHCKTYMKMGYRTIRTLWSISREAPMVIVSKLNVLQQLLHNCLNSCLDRLIGPRCLELKMSKGPATDLDQYDFKPKEILQMIVEMYVAVAREDKARVMTMITEDGRNYKPKTFTKAVSMSKRDGMLPKDVMKDFEEFVQGLNELAASQEAALASIDIPDHYLDPIMAEIMEDPVELPTSKTIMDRKVIERHIMSNDDDPFNRAHLSVADLVPQTELRAEIHAFCAKHGIAIGGDD